MKDIACALVLIISTFMLIPLLAMIIEHSFNSRNSVITMLIEGLDS